MTTEATIEVRLEKVVEAIQARMWLDGTYQAEYSKEKNAGPIRRQILPFRVYRSREGDLVVNGSTPTTPPSARSGWIGSCAWPRASGTRATTRPCWLPARARSRSTRSTGAWSRARPQKVSEQALDKFLSRGWSLTPYPGVVEPPRAH